MPDFGIGEAAALLYDYGPRGFTVGFDEQLKLRASEILAGLARTTRTS